MLEAANIGEVNAGKGIIVMLGGKGMVETVIYSKGKVEADTSNWGIV